jgi:hypothetical protein
MQRAMVGGCVVVKANEHAELQSLLTVSSHYPHRADTTKMSQTLMKFHM